MLLFLVYHRITESQDRDFRSIHPETFRRHLETIQAAGMPVIDPGSESLLVGLPGIVLTFDDATVDHFATARPILAEFGFPGLFYVPTARLDGRGYLATEQVAQLSEEGHTIGSHSHSHERLDVLADPAVRHELEVSRSRIEEIVGSPPVHFAPPGGLYRTPVVTISEQIGYRFFRTMKWGFNRRLNTREIEVVPLTTLWSHIFLDWALNGTNERTLKLMHGLKTGLQEALPDGVYRWLRSRWLT